ncbi:MAG TPA: hypothetical protein VMU88_08970 [bacterium]|nr:hypothetical protein [bacterium]
MTGFGGRVRLFALAACLLSSSAPAGTTYLDLSAAANRGPADSFDQTFPDAPDREAKNGLAQFPVGDQTFRGIPFRLLDPSRNQNRSFIALKGRERPDFPEAVTLKGPGGGVQDLYFLQTCHWGGTAADIRVAQYEVLYGDGRGVTIPLRVGREFTNFWGADDTAESFLAWYYRYKNAGLGVSLFAWKNPRPGQSIHSIVFRSLAKMPVPLLFAVTASDQDLPISPLSPKPEAGSSTDMTGWAPLELSGGPEPPALDFSGTLDAPAGRHGPVTVREGRLYFTDGTPARFWGTRLSIAAAMLSDEQAQGLADRLAQRGFNLVALDLSGAVSQVGAPGPSGFVSGSVSIGSSGGLFGALKSKGIYVLLDPGSGQGGVTVFGDAAVVPLEDLQYLRADYNPVSKGATAPLMIQNVPQLLNPGDSLPAQLAAGRSFGRPVLAEWSEGWPQSYLAETPLLMGAEAALQGWDACVGEDLVAAGDGSSLTPGTDWYFNPLLYLQEPLVSLAYRRGDLKEGKAFIIPEEDPDGLESLAHQSGKGPGTTDPAGVAKAKVKAKLKTFLSDSGQVQWQGNIGLFQVQSPRFQAVAGFFSHRQVKGSAWEFESPNWFGSVSLISLTDKPIARSDHLLLSGVTRLENVGMVYNAAQTKVLSLGQGPIWAEPLKAKILIYRANRDPRLKAQALGADLKPLDAKVPLQWKGNNLSLSWVPGAFYLELYK